ncbi:MAG: hypothetical protein JWN80_2921 [Microbacteriaceae bacterium]|jgi:hypothetical protein|nr:hypothetical protein [Microbacteriaceae bacterium]
MAGSLAEDAFEGVRFSFSDIDEVTETAEGLLVNGTLFAFLEGDDLVVELPFARSNDLVERGIAVRFAVEGVKARDWVRVSDQQLWPELARESHEFVGEPAVGGDS